jgi:Asp-tRNA(Asn)/Glu-tRNA(Gln) amidotransferase A subunit family amidase
VTIFLARPEWVGEGIRLAVKTLFDTAGLRTTYGSILFADHVPARTAKSVARLEAAGYVNVGRTNLHELARPFFRGEIVTVEPIHSGAPDDDR